MASRPEAGTKAPDFALPVAGGGYPEGATVRLADLQGAKVVLYFYPKDDTPGCTTQACGIRDAWDELLNKARVFGISVDTVAKHQKFIAKYQLPFPLLSDESQAMVQAYGVWVEKKMYGKTYFGIERTTFVLDEQGMILAVRPQVKPAEHVNWLREVLG